jgi:hypothetical protein
MKWLDSRALLVVCFVISALAAKAMPAASEAGGALKPGLVRVHFDASDFKRPKNVVIEPQINFDTGTKHHDYSRILLGHIRIPTSQPITFSAEVDDGFTLGIGGRRVIDGWQTSQREGKLTARERGNRLHHGRLDPRRRKLAPRARAAIGPRPCAGRVGPFARLGGCPTAGWRRGLSLLRGL